MKRIIQYSVLSFLPLVFLLGISSANQRTVSTPAFTAPAETEAAPSCRRVHGAACAPEGTSVRCAIGDPVQIRICVCEDGAFNCR
jgi:hypothetical protein